VSVSASAGPAPQADGDLPAGVKDLLDRSRSLLHSPPDPSLSPLAIELCRRALEQVPGHPVVASALARALHAHGKSEEAAAACEAALAAHPEAVELQLERLLLTIPVVYRDAEQVEASRATYEARLGELEQRLARAPAGELARLGRRARRVYPYLLPYQGRNDAALQRRLGLILRRAVLTAEPDIDAEPARPAPGEPLRVGFVSDHFRNHTIWHVITRAWVAGLHERGFAVYGYALGERDDDCTDASRRECVRFLTGKRSVSEWARVIREDRPHALIYPALGYSGTVDKLALARLAPVQCTTSGHCETSGYPTMDYFLGSALWEPGDGDAHYTETLVLLPDLGLSYPAVRVEPSERGHDHPGLRRDAVLYLSPHLAKKNLPEHDELYARIAERDPEAQLVVFKDPRVTAVSRVLERRLRSVFTARGVDPDGRLVFLDRLGRRDYEALVMAADMYLDVPGWNGGTTTAEALVRHLPVVTLEGEVARGRMGAGMLRHLSVTDGLARTPDDYVRRAVALGREAGLRTEVRRRLAQNGRRIHEDGARLDGLAAFLEGAIRKAAEPGGSHPG
jgi:predicted O-linked N-acetylglucosamine transferase (SPINDLY family)